MAYDDVMAMRLRDALGGRAVEKRMMGGLIFMLDGNMVAGVDRDAQGQGRFMFRVGPSGMDEALGRPGAAPVRMGERTMKGFVFVSETDAVADFAGWVALARAFTDTLPPK